MSNISSDAPTNDEPPPSSWQLEIDAPFSFDIAADALAPVGQGSVPPASLSPPSLHRLLEAMLFISGTPIAIDRAAEVIRGLTNTQLRDAVDSLNSVYRQQGRPYKIEQCNDGYFLALRPTYRFVPEKLQGGIREARLSVAAIEVLSIIAYRQPVSKHQIDALRGHDSGHLVRHLIRRGLVDVRARTPSGGPVCFGTTKRFLEFFGLGNLDDLPQTEDLQRL